MLNSFTVATPLRVILSSRAARCDRSRLRPGTNGPQSLIRTATVRPFSTFMTRTIEPIGIVVEAAVSFSGLKRSPLLVRCPANPGPYHEALIVGTGAGFTIGGGSAITGGGAGSGVSWTGVVAHALKLAVIANNATGMSREGKACSSVFKWEPRIFASKNWITGEQRGCHRRGY